MNLTALPVRPRCRVIVDNDWSGDPDGLLALAHHLLSPSNRVVAVTSSFLSPQFGSPLSRAADGAGLAARLVEEVGPAEPPIVAAGCESPFDATPSEGDAPPAVDAIIAEAHRDERLPLYLVCWVGGSLDPATPEYNRDTDPAAAAYVLDRSDLEITQIPVEAYQQCAVSVAELEHGLCSNGALGRWLFERFTSLHLPEVIELGEVWPIGDSPRSRVTTP